MFFPCYFGITKQRFFSVLWLSTSLLLVRYFQWVIIYWNTVGLHIPLFSKIKEEIIRSQSSFLVSSKTRIRSNRLKRGLPRAMFTETDSWGSYWPLGLVAARMVVLVFSLHTSLSKKSISH